MEPISLKGIIIDIDYLTRDQASVIRVTLKSGGKIYVLLDPDFYPYFYLVPSNRSLETGVIAGLKVQDASGGYIPIRGAEECRMFIDGKHEKVMKVYAKSTKDIPKLSQAFGEFGERFEYDIVFWKRYLIDKRVSPLSEVEIHTERFGDDWIIKSIKNTGMESTESMSHFSFDIETYNKAGGIPRPEKDPAIMISYTDGKDSAVLSTKNPGEGFIKVFNDEKAMVEGFAEIVKQKDPDIIVGYNSSNFDLPYLKARAEANLTNLDIGRISGDVRGEHHGLLEAYKIPGRINLDLYNAAKFVAVVGAAASLLKVDSFKIGDVYTAITGKEMDLKLKMEKANIWKFWDSEGEGLRELFKYSLDDAVSLEELYDFFLPLEMEVAKVSGTTLGETSISTTGQLVEFTLMRSAHEHNCLIPNKPSENEIDARLANPYEGAYVKEPEAGIYDNIAVFDFKGLYPSIIIAHNIDNFTICSDCDDAFVSPDGTRFRKDIPGVIPAVLKRLLDERNNVKKLSHASPNDKRLEARYWALKILANSFYGYMGYPRSRWYSRKCAASVTAYSRKFITDTIKKAEDDGFKVLYSDTDSIFIILQKRTRDDVDKFMKDVNKALPAGMELEFEDLYMRGVFVGKRGGKNGAGAKKKYALLSDSGKIKIRGFELVRRDWSKIAKDTQKAVLETILKEGDKDKAAAIVKEVVERLRSGTVPVADLAMHTQLKKSLKNYDVKSPEVSAAKRAVENGVKTVDEVEHGMISYVITNHGSTISEKAELEETAKDYDPDYYINNQIIPSTMKILKELGYDAAELKTKGSQKKL